MEPTPSNANKKAAIWRSMSGRDVFTGMVKVADASDESTGIKKLNDPKGDLDGPGHIVSMAEFASQCALYDDSTYPRVQEAIDVWSFKQKEADATRDDLVYLSKHPDFELWPHDPTLVRADDIVLLKSNHTIEVEKVIVHERFPARVISITPCGLVTAAPTVTLNWVDISPNKPILVPITAVMAVEHGIHWETA